MRSDTRPRAEAGDWTDRVLDVEVGPVAHGGHCVARHDGRVVFVRHALPGERVLAVVTEDTGGSFCRADAISVRDPHAGRVAPACTWARAGGCGGCDWQHAAPSLQRELKTAVVREQLSRLAGIDSDVEVEELPGGPLGWRSRVRLAVAPEGRAGLRAHRSHDVLPVADCPIAPEGALPGVLARPHAPGSEFEIVVDADGTVHDERDGAPVVQRAVGREWRLRPGAFWQVHPELAGTLAGVVGEWGQARPGESAWDLYGGAGLFASVLAGQVGRDGEVTVVESSSGAVDDGEVALDDLPQITWRVGRVEHVLDSLADPDVVVTDPPRSGLGKALVAGICERGPRRIVHVACDPAALGRDVGLFAAQGYRLTALRAFDAFPMTHHMECVALLEPEHPAQA
ncbi:MAG: RNA methyltransferase [Pseudonocardia sp. SCN 72-86]|nr:MAG: RNA methyltransferase [Pseudonocardia sp. SCN 72-86]